MEDINLPDVYNVKGSNNKRELPPQTSFEDTSNLDNRAIAPSDPKRSGAQFIVNGDSYAGIVLAIENPYNEQGQLTSVKSKS